MTTQQEAWDQFLKDLCLSPRATQYAHYTELPVRESFDAGWNARGETLAQVAEEINEGLYAIHEVLKVLCPSGFPIDKADHTPEQWQIKMAYHHIHNAQKLLSARPDAE